MTTAFRPMSPDELTRRGFCRCPQRSQPRPQQGTVTDGDDLPVCPVHPDDMELPEDERLARNLVFYDDRRHRHVTWPDAVEAMRQGRYAGAGNLDLMMFTWRNLLALLGTLRSPATEVDLPATEEAADELIAWAGDHLDHDQLRWLLVFARGGGAAVMCELFRFAGARAGHSATGGA
jgi:hypothetical protein